jgi:hypothetical protein
MLAVFLEIQGDDGVRDERAKGETVRYIDEET